MIRVLVIIEYYLVTLTNRIICDSSIPMDDLINVLTEYSRFLNDLDL